MENNAEAVDRKQLWIKKLFWQEDKTRKKTNEIVARTHARKSQDNNPRIEREGAMDT